MIWSLLPIFIGTILVLQSGLNDIIQREHGLSYAMLLNNIVFITISLLFVWYQASITLGADNILKVQNPLALKWWYFLPGVAGAIIVGGSAISFEKAGASKTLILLVGSQIIVGFAWDYFASGKPIDWKKLSSGTLILLGSYLAYKD